MQAFADLFFRAVELRRQCLIACSPEEEIRERLQQSRNILEAARSKRPAPHRDDKIVTAWNGLAIGALARGARVLQRADLANAAGEAAGFLKRELWNGDRLYRSYRGRRGGVAGFPADYAFLISGVIELHGISPEDAWLDWAIDLQRAFDQAYWDASRAGYVMRAELSGNLLMQIREDYDGAEPSPNHVAAVNLLKLAALCDDDAFRKQAEALLRSGARILETQPYAAPVLLDALDMYQRGVMKFQIPNQPTASAAEKLRTSYFPRAVFSDAPGDEVLLCEGMTCRLFT